MYEEFEKEIKNLTPEEHEYYDFLDNMIEELDTAGVDVSFFPERAYLVLIQHARRLANKDLKRREG